VAPANDVDSPYLEYLDSEQVSSRADNLRRTPEANIIYDCAAEAPAAAGIRIGPSRCTCGNRMRSADSTNASATKILRRAQHAHDGIVCGRWYPARRAPEVGELLG
jgi:hypothetical protein